MGARSWPAGVGEGLRLRALARWLSWLAVVKAAMGRGRAVQVAPR